MVAATMVAACHATPTFMITISHSLILRTAICSLFSLWTVCVEHTVAAQEDQELALKTEEMGRAQSLDVVSVPTSGEFFAAINKSAFIDWSALRREGPSTNVTDRSRIALNIGGLIADGYIAVEQQDAQQVKNIGRDIITLAKALGVNDQVISRGGSITEFADNAEWSALKEEFEATQNEVKKALEAQFDEPLILLVTLGGWLRGTQVAASAISSNYSPEAAKLLRQPTLAAYLRGKLDLLPERFLEDPVVREVRDGIIAIEKLLTIPRDQIPSPELVGLVRDEASKAVTAITRRPQ